MQLSHMLILVESIQLEEENLQNQIRNDYQNISLTSFLFDTCSYNKQLVAKTSHTPNARILPRI